MGANSSALVIKRLLILLQLAFNNSRFSLDEVWGLPFYIEIDDRKKLSQTLSDDFQRLRDWMGIDIASDYGVYYLHQIDPALRDLFLPDEIISVVAIAKQLPQVQPYFDRQTVESLLTKTRLRLGTDEYLLDDCLIDTFGRIPYRDSDSHISVSLRQTLHQAIVSQRIICFDYSANRPDGFLVHHRMEPYGLVVKDGHLYLDGFTHTTTSPVGSFEQYKHFLLRVGRIVPTSLALTDEVFTSQHDRPSFQVHYILSARLAQNGASRLSARQHSFHELPDGRVEVYTTTTDVFDTMRQLLSYGSACQVLGGPELLSVYEREIDQLHSVYVGEQE
jgi:predicted DNA-binding transcriptional regulator YafY